MLRVQGVARILPGGWSGVSGAIARRILLRQERIVVFELVI